nr:hypothetical protein [Tanacetum cinerariifolium]
MQDDELDPSKVKEVVEVVSNAKLITKVVTAAAATITVVATATPTILTTAHSVARRRKGVVIRDPEETATPSTIIYSKPKSKYKGKGIMIQDGLFKGMSYDAIRPIFEKYFNSNVAFLEKSKAQLEEKESRALKRKVESSEEKAAKKQKLDEEVEKLRKHLHIVPNDDDDVYIKATPLALNYIEATPLALKVPIVNYEIYTQNNKPYYKIKRADGSHQLYLNFLSMLRNFNREDLEVLWKFVEKRFASLKPKNFSYDFLLTTLRAMFEKPDV